MSDRLSAKVDELYAELTEKLFTIQNHISTGQVVALRQKAQIFEEIKKFFVDSVNELMNDKVNQSLNVIEKYKLKYNTVQMNNSSIVPVDGFFGETKRNIDNTDKLLLLMFQLITDDIAKLREFNGFPE